MRLIELNNVKHPFERLFQPKNIMIYEISAKSSFFIDGLIRQGFDITNLYLVSSKLDIINDIKCYKAINDIPSDSIDLVILSIRREFLLEKIKEILNLKNVKFFHIFTAGTGEADEIGVEIEKQLKELLSQYKETRAIGPNCMGVYCPRGKIAYYGSFPTELGNIGLIFQSGDLHSRFIKFGSKKYNLRISKGVSIGNCVDIQISEMIEFFDNDEETEIICVYQEGFSPFYPNEGRRLFNILKKIKKPVLFMRGGKTARGQMAVLTHTGSLVSDREVWKALFKQTIVTETSSSLDDIIEHAYMFCHYIVQCKKLDKTPLFPTQKRALVILWSGGFGILATDLLTEFGIELPHFTGDKLRKLKEIYPAIIGSLENPFDLPWINSKKEFLDVCTVAIDENIDLVLVETDAWRDQDSKRFKNYYYNLTQIKKHTEDLGKIFVIILHEYPSESRKLFYEKLIADDFLVYPTIQAAAKSFLKLCNYGQKLRNILEK
jgi:acyl-CoA synthetase (NDP forming)